MSELKLKDSDLHIILSELHEVRVKWYDIGIQLTVSTGDLDSVSVKERDPSNCLRCMLVTWLRSGKATWAALCKSIASPTVGEGELATKLTEKYLRQDQQLQTCKLNHISATV